MYDEHYGLSGRPFQLTPDPRFWFDTATHKKAMAYLGYGLSQGEGFIVITGDIGAGKTTLVGHLVDTVDAERLNVIKIVSTQIAADDLLRTVCAGLDVDGEGMSKAQMLSAIERGLHAVARSGRRTLLIVDEVQALPVDSLEELRMLSNFQAGGHALLQIFLLGQPEFREKLGDNTLEQLRQRVIAMHHLGPMEADELESYLVHRLTVVGWDGRPRFKTDALATIYAWSGGIPRRINQLVSRVLLHGAIEGIEVFTAADVLAVVGDLGADGMTGGVTPDVEPELDFDDTRPIAVEPAITDVPEPLPIVADAPAIEAPALMEWPFVKEPAVAATTVAPPADDWREIMFEQPAPVAESIAEDEPEPAVETRPVQISTPPRLGDRVCFGRKPVLAPVDPAPMAEVPVDIEAPVETAETPSVVDAQVQTAKAPPVVDAPVEIGEASPVLDAPVETTEAPPVVDLDVARRLAEIERRLEDQDAALRRVLTLLVDWVESGAARPDFSGQGFPGLRDKVG